MTIKYSDLIAYAIGIIFLFLLGRVLTVPMKFIIRCFYNLLIGGVVILLVNLVGGFFNYHLALNAFSALAVGFLGVPGIALMVILKGMIGI